MDQQEDIIITLTAPDSGITFQIEPISSLKRKYAQRKRNSAAKKRKLELKCEWEDCFIAGNFDSVDEFSDHVAQNHAKVGHGDGTRGRWCSWKGCEFQLEEDDDEQEQDLERHINFHAFHTKIKQLGDHVIKVRKYVHL